MALATRCPHCSTTFRVANDQLKLHAGLVRCGKCQQTFNGVENLIPLDAQGRALSQSLPVHASADNASDPVQSPDQDKEVAATLSVAAVEINASQAPVVADQPVSAHSHSSEVATQTAAIEIESVIEVAADSALTQSLASEPETKPAAADKTTSPGASAFIESKALRVSEASHASSVIQHVTPLSRPEVWRHAPTSAGNTANSKATSTKADANPLSSQSKETENYGKGPATKPARPIARPIDSAKVGDVWASQAAKSSDKSELLAKIEPTLDEPKEPSLRASDLEFDLSMPTRQFIDPALADEWFKLEQASVSPDTPQIDNANATEKSAQVAHDARQEPHWDEPQTPAQAEQAVASSDSTSTSSTLTDLEHHTVTEGTIAIASVPTNSAPDLTSVPAAIDTPDVTTLPANQQEDVKTVEPNPAETAPDLAPLTTASPALLTEESLLAKTVLMSESDALEPVEARTEIAATEAQVEESSSTIHQHSAVEVEPPTANPSQENARAEDAEEPGFVLAAERARRWSRITTVLMSLALILLLPLLLAQLAYTGRNYLVQWYPPSKPYLLQACHYLQCQIKLPAQIDYVNIDSHELQAQLPEKNIYALNLLVQNQSPFAQAWPHVELILHDKREKPVLRKVFTPSDYLSPQELQHVNDTGLAAKGDYTIKLYFEQANTKAAGYHVSVFYP